MDIKCFWGKELEAEEEKVLKYKKGGHYGNE
jgi:hypothetical protein